MSGSKVPLPVTAALKFTLVSRLYCHLCHEMELALRALVATYPVEIEILDVDAHPGLEARYGELVPVLFAEDVELCHYVLDSAKVSDLLSKIR